MFICALTLLRPPVADKGDGDKDATVEVAAVRQMSQNNNLEWPEAEE